ncbi:aldehyde dehydrogenase [Glomus cerebriforme]|uniref:Aldehyde dehydrogenase n=1 Tax=Glomus cerebriforme TaxID=658196 RepID=A0A397SIQ8_9GLOM|nr:aldehyde dehydrogenase [Glomus cerebriforme]
MNHSNVLQNLSRIARPFINNKFIIPTSSHISKSLINPSTEESFIQVIEGISSDVDLAVKAATDALHSTSWLSLNGADRRNILLKIADGIDKNLEELALIESLNVGKPLKDAKLEVSESAECFRFFAGYADKLTGHTFCVDNKYRLYTIREPIGICGLITSFNYPLLLASWKVAPSLACGNAIILKPAPQTPLTSLMLANIISTETELPSGIFNVIPGDEIIGKSITEHKGIDKCSFTGSEQVGRKVLSASSLSNLKSVTLELGGKNAMIVFSDVNIDKAVEDVYWATFSNSGQNCCAGSRLFLEENIHDEFLNKLKKRIENTKIGNSLDETIDLGPLIDHTQFQKVQKILNNTINELKDNNKLLIGGKRFGDVGFFIEPTVFYDLDDSEYISKEEIFGPVLSVLKPFNTIEEVIKRANNTKFGLAAGVWTNNYLKAEKVVREIKVGTTWVNCYNLTPSYLPFGGRKFSGFGKDLGEESINEFSFIKSVTYSL